MEALSMDVTNLLGAKGAVADQAESEFLQWPLSTFETIGCLDMQMPNRI
jgi:hypothetical protein